MAWQDWLGQWHASVSVGRYGTAKARAYRLVQYEMEKLGQKRRIKFRTERITAHGTVVFGER